MPAPVRITVGNETASGNSLEVFVHTGSLETPLVCCADNNAFPEVHAIYARPSVYQGLNGVHVTVRFDQAARGNGFAFNVWQPSMTGPYTAIHV
jgi:hypothetical protein